MARPPRCLLPDLEAVPLQLDADGRHHVERVLRLRAGEALELVDGAGGLIHARLAAKGQLEVVERAPRAKPPSAPVWLAVAPPRPTRLDWLVEKAVELGVTEILLMQTRHAVREIDAKRVARLQRIADEALLQCRRLFRAEVHPSQPWDDVLQRDAELWLADVPRETHPDGDPEAAERASDGCAALGRDGAEHDPATTGLPTRRDDRPLLLLVGPEGGFHADERAAALRRGAHPVSCGRGVLRVETAALALAVLARG